MYVVVIDDEIDAASPWPSKNNRNSDASLRISLSCVDSLIQHKRTKSMCERERERAEHRSPDYRTAFQVPAMLRHDVNHVLASILMFSWSNQNTTGTNANLYTYIYTRRSSSLQIFRNRNIFRWSSASLFQLLSCPKSGHFIWWFEVQTFSEDDWIMAQLLSIVEDCIQLLMRKLLLALFIHTAIHCVCKCAITPKSQGICILL